MSDKELDNEITKLDIRLINEILTLDKFINNLKKEKLKREDDQILILVRLANKFKLFTMREVDEGTNVLLIKEKLLEKLYIKIGRQHVKEGEFGNG